MAADGGVVHRVHRLRAHDFTARAAHVALIGAGVGGRVDQLVGRPLVVHRQLHDVVFERSSNVDLVGAARRQPIVDGGGEHVGKGVLQVLLRRRGGNAGALGKVADLLDRARNVGKVVAQREAVDDDSIGHARAAEHQHRDVVELRRFADELLHRSQHGLDRVEGTALGAGQQVGLHPLVAELLFLPVGRLRHAVGIDEQLAVRRDFDLSDVIGESVEHRQRHAAGQRQPLRAPRSYQDGRVVAAVGIHQAAVALIEDAVEDGDEQVGARRVDERFVHHFQTLAGAVLDVAGGGADHGAGHRHEQRGGYALARHVADDDADAVVVEGEEVVEVAPHLLGRVHGRVNVRAAGVEGLAGQKRALHPGRDLQVVLQGHVGGLGAQRLLQLRYQGPQAFLLPAHAVGHLLEREAHHLQVAGGVLIGGRVAARFRARRRGSFDLGEIGEYVLALLLVQGGREAGHLAADEPFLLALAARRPAAVPPQRDGLGAEGVDRLGDARQLVVAAPFSHLDHGLRVAVGERVQHAHPVGKGRQRPPQVVGQPQQRQQQEAADRGERDQAYPALLGVRGAHVADGDHLRHQMAQFRFQRKAGQRPHAAAVARLLGGAFAEPRGAANRVPHLRGGAHQQAPAPVHDQGLGAGIFLQLGQRLDDVGGVDGHRQRRAGGVGQRHAERQGDVALRVDCHPAAAPALGDHCRQGVFAGGRGRLERRFRRVQHLAGEGHQVEPGHVAGALQPGDQVARRVRNESPIVADERRAQGRVLLDDRRELAHALDSGLDDLAPQRAAAADGGLVELVAQQRFALNPGEHQPGHHHRHEADDDDADSRLDSHDRLVDHPRDAQQIERRIDA